MQDLFGSSFMNNRRKGVTITEVVASLALVVLSIGGILAVVFQSVDLSQSGERLYIAADIAKNRIERLREIRKDDGYAALGMASESDVIVGRNGIADPGGDYIRTTAIDTGYSSNLTKVTVSVGYKRRGEFNPVEITLVTLISAYS